MIERLEGFLTAADLRPDVDPFVAACFDHASRVPVHGKIHSHRAGVIEVQGPDVQRSARKVHPAGGFRDDSHAVLSLQ